MIETADDIIAALRSIIADYEEHHYVHKVAKPEFKLSGAAVPGKAAPASPVPQTPAGAATLPVEDLGRRIAMRGRSLFLTWYAERSDDERKRLQAIADEIKGLFP
jgi:hypothetical protein